MSGWRQRWDRLRKVKPSKWPEAFQQGWFVWWQKHIDSSRLIKETNWLHGTVRWGQNHCWWFMGILLALVLITVWPPGAEGLRRLGLVGGGIISLILLWRRAVSSDQQARAANEQIQVALHDQQAKLYQQGIELLWDKELAKRYAGITLLWKLAQEYIENYHIEVMEAFCAFIRDASYPSPEKKSRNPYKSIFPPDKHMILGLIGTRSQEQRDQEEINNFRMDLSGAHLEGADIRGYHLEKANLSGAYLQGAYMQGACFEGADFSYGKL